MTARDRAAPLSVGLLTTLLLFTAELLLPSPAGAQEATLTSHSGVDVLWTGEDVRGVDLQLGLRWDVGLELTAGYGYGFTGGEGQTLCPAVPDYTTPVICDRRERLPTVTVFRTAYFHPRFWIGGAPRTPPTGWPDRVEGLLPEGVPRSGRDATGVTGSRHPVAGAASHRASADRRLERRGADSSLSPGFWETTGFYVGPRLGWMWGNGLDGVTGSEVGVEAGVEVRRSKDFSFLAAVVLDRVFLSRDDGERWESARTGLRLGTVLHF